jgi:hypothetical protein
MLLFFSNILSNKKTSLAQSNLHHFDLFSLNEEAKINFNSYFDGKVRFFNSLNLSQKSHFHYSDWKSYLFFKSYFNKLSLCEFVEIESNLTEAQILGVFKYIDKEKFNKKLNVVIQDYPSFYSVMGSQFISDVFLPLLNRTDVQVSIVGKNIPSMVKGLSSNNGESSGQNFYFNNLPFDDCFNKFKEVDDLTKNKPILKNNFYLYDDFQSFNKHDVSEGDLIFTKNEEFWVKHGDYAPFVQSHPHRRLDMNGRFNYYHLLYKDTEKMIVCDFLSRKVGIIESDKFSQFHKAKIRLGDLK